MTLRLFLCCCLLTLPGGARLWAQVAVPASAPQGEQEAFAAGPLRWKFVVGAVEHYRLTQQLDMTLSLAATHRALETRTRQVLDWHWRVESVDPEGNAHLALTIERLQLELQTPEAQTMHLDTAAEESPAGFASMLVPLAKMLSEAPLQVTLSPQGILSDLVLPENLAQALQAIPGNTLAKTLPSATELTAAWQQCLGELPAQLPLNWSTTSQLPDALLGPLRRVTEYRHLGVREVNGRPQETFAITTQIDFPDPGENLSVEVVRHTSSGELCFDRQAGRLESNQLGQTTELEIVANGQASRQTLHQSIDLVRMPPPPQKAD